MKPPHQPGHSNAAQQRAAAAVARVGDGPPAWRPRKPAHYRNIVILGGFGCLGIVLIIAAFLTLPPPDENIQPPSNGGSPNTTVPYARRAQIVDTLAKEGACDPPPRDKRQWLRATLNTILSFGTRVGGSWSRGYNDTRNLLLRFTSCESVHPSRRHWDVWLDDFTTATVWGPRTFSNVIAELNHPPRKQGYGSAGHLVLAAHWDSKHFDNFDFVGACDSAAPVAMLLLLMRDIAEAARRANVDPATYDPSFPSYTILFFDGEEAFVEWRGTDNTYGSRHLAALYEARGAISTISLFVLLDLLGPVNTVFRNYHPSESGAYFKLISNIERDMKRGHQLRRPPHAPLLFPAGPSSYGGVEDDHIPWMKRRVKVLHLIPTPFPPSWHTAADDGTNVDDDTLADLYDIISTFATKFHAIAPPS